MHNTKLCYNWGGIIIIAPKTPHQEKGGGIMVANTVKNSKGRRKKYVRLKLMPIYAPKLNQLVDMYDQVN